MVVMITSVVILAFCIYALIVSEKQEKQKKHKSAH